MGHSGFTQFRIIQHCMKLMSIDLDLDLVRMNDDALCEPTNERSVQRARQVCPVLREGSQSGKCLLLRQLQVDGRKGIEYARTGLQELGDGIEDEVFDIPCRKPAAVGRYCARPADEAASGRPPRPSRRATTKSATRAGVTAAGSVTPWPARCSR